MALPGKLIEKLCCPICRSGLEYRQAHQQLVCSGCDVLYKVVDDVPVLQTDEAEKVENR